MITVELKGMDSVKQMFASIKHELSPAQVRGLMDSAGQLLAKEARSEVEEQGEIGQFFKQDIGVSRDHRKSARNAEYILVGPRFKNYTIHGQSQKVATIVQHMTEGFSQTERETRKGERRGHVAMQFQNPILNALQSKKDEISGAIEKGVNKQLDRVKAKHPEVVK